MRVFLLLLVLARVAAADPLNAVIGDRGVPVDAMTETARIRGHLSFVLHALRTQDVELDAAHRARREASLDELARYIATGVFPRRTGDAFGERRPRFIDDRGVHCAVADLIAASGNEELARMVNATHEYDYVLDMNEPALDAWAAANGFTLVELAMIQPTYHEWPPDEEARILLSKVADDLVLKCATRGRPSGYIALTVEGRGKHLVVTTPNADPFEQCFAKEASALGNPAHRDESFTLETELSLRTPQQILDRRLAQLDTRGCMPRPGDLPDRATVSVEHGSLVVATAPINPEVAACLFDRLESTLRPFLVLDVRGEVTKPVARYTPQVFDSALRRAGERIANECEKVTGDGESMSIGAGATLDGDVWVEIPGTTKFAGCLRERLPPAIREYLAVPREGSKYFRIDADVKKRPQYIKCGNGVCY